MSQSMTMMPPRKQIRSGIWLSGFGVGVGVGGNGDGVNVGNGVKVGVGVRTGNKSVSEGNGARVVVTVGLTEGVEVIVEVSDGVDDERGREVKVTT
jgi:hypothetical protein